jgi:putative transposase
LTLFLSVGMAGHMPRPKREDYPGAFHHVMNRGARRAPIFKLKDDCVGFLDLLGDTVGRFGLEVHAFSLMPNHYHLLVRSRLGNLSEALQHLNGNYTQWLNRRHRWDGPVFRGRFKSQLVTDEKHLRYLLAYIHLNPVSVHLVPRLTSEAWTSHRAYIRRENRPEWLSTGLFLELLGGPKKLHEFVLSVHRGAKRYPEDFDPETGLFKKKALQGERDRKRGSKQRGRVMVMDKRHLNMEEVLAKVCRMTGASEGELRAREKGRGANPARRFAIWALYRGAGIKQREIAKRLNVTLYQVSKLLSRLRNEEASEPVAGWMNKWLAEE